MSQYFHIVPWYNTSEWRHVYEKIYTSSSTLVDKEEALKTLLIWKARCASLPSGVESTMTLLHVHIQDLKKHSDINDEMIRLAYSTALMRFVNHMLDDEKLKHSSFYQAAKNLGIPDWIIDMRHDTAHSNNLPTTCLLREATLISLDWLRINYWEKQSKCIHDYVSGQKDSIDNDEFKITALMRFCVSLSICGHSGCGIRNLSDIPDDHLRESVVNDARDLFGDFNDFSNLKTVSLQSVINIMKTESKKLLISKDVSVFVNKTLLGDDSIFLSQEIFCELCPQNFRTKNQLPKHYVQCFELLLTFLHASNLLLEFNMELIKITENNDFDHNKRLLAALWTSEILKNLMKCKIFHERNKTNFNEIKFRKRNELKSLFYHWFPNEKARVFLFDFHKRVPHELMDIKYIHPIISTYNPYLTHFLRDLLNLVNPQLSKQTKDKICNLGKLISSPDQFPAVSTKIFTIDDLEKHNIGNENEECQDSGNDSDCYMLNDEEDITDEHSENQGGLWKITTHTHGWSTHPFGQLPWQTNTVSMQTESK